MNLKISKKEAERQVEDFFQNIKEKTPREIKKIKKIAANKKIRLGEKKKLFCKKCLMPYKGDEKIRIKNGRKIVECGNCGYVARWQIKK